MNRIIWLNSMAKPAQIFKIVFDQTDHKNRGIWKLLFISTLCFTQILHNK